MTGLRSLSLLLAGAALAFGACDEQPTQPTQIDLTAEAKGNGFPDGPHDYNLHIIGVPKDKTADLDGNNGRRIFVQLHSDAGDEVTNPGGKNNHRAKGGGDDQNQIFLCNSTNDEGDSRDSRCADYGNPGGWGVIDANATDGDGALLAVPDPCAGDDSTDGCTPRYAVFARALAGGSARLTTCAEEDQAYDGTQDTWCGSNGITLYPTRGRKAQDVSGSLLSMAISVDEELNPELTECIDPRIDTTDDTFEVHDFDVYLFDRCFQDYFWNYDNHGLKNLELRFYWADA